MFFQKILLNFYDKEILASNNILTVLYLFILYNIIGAYMNLTFVIEEKDNNKSIKEFLKQNYISNRLLFKLRKNNCIFCNNSISEVNYIVHTGDLILVNLDYEEDNSNIVSTYIPLDIIYEDSHYLVINKQPNIAIHPSVSHYDNSLSNGVRYYFDSIRIKKKN